MGAGFGQHHIDECPSLDHQARQLRRLVGGHPAGDTEHYALACQFYHDE